MKTRNYMQTLPITTALCGFTLGLLLASQCNTGGGTITGSDTTRTITQPPKETITGIPATIDYGAMGGEPWAISGEPWAMGKTSGVLTSLNGQSPTYNGQSQTPNAQSQTPNAQSPKPNAPTKYIRIPVYVHDTTPGRTDTHYVYVPKECEGCRFTATSDGITTAHGDKMRLRYYYPANQFDVVDFQPAPDTNTTVTNYVENKKHFAVTLGGYGGYDAFRKDFSAGIAVQIGWKLAEFW